MCVRPNEITNRVSCRILGRFPLSFLTLTCNRCSTPLRMICSHTQGCRKDLILQTKPGRHRHLVPRALCHISRIVSSVDSFLIPFRIMSTQLSLFNICYCGSRDLAQRKSLEPSPPGCTILHHWRPPERHIRLSPTPLPSTGIPSLRRAAYPIRIPRP